MSYGEDDVRKWVQSSRTEYMNEVFSPMRSLADIGPDRYDELARRQLVGSIMEVLESAIDGTFGQHIAEAYTSHNELYELADEIATATVQSDRWKNIRRKIKSKEDF